MPRASCRVLECPNRTLADLGAAADRAHDRDSRKVTSREAIQAFVEMPGAPRV
jgi:hypothetical protein